MNTPRLKRSERRGPIAWMAGHSVAANLVMLMCLIGGFLCLRHMKQEVFPEIQIDTVTITVAYPGASPEEVESGILLSIEEAIRGLDGIKEISSTAREGSGTVTAEVLVGADMQQVAQDIQSEVDRITTLPDEAEEPVVQQTSHHREVLEVMLYGDMNKKVLHELGEQMRDRLTQHPEITLVELTGLPDLEIGIEVSQENLRRYGLTLSDVANAIDNGSLDLAGGGLKTESGEVLVRVKERRDYGMEFARLPVVTASDGSQVMLGDIATVDDSFADTDRYTTYNGMPALILEVYRVGDETPIEVAAAVREVLEESRPELPPGLHTAIENDRSSYYRERVQLLLKNGALGLVLVLLTLGLFLEIRLAFWVMMGIPISFLASFLILPATGVSINMISLFAYIIALGIVVDDAIVVGENVYHYHQEGMDFLSAAIRGTREVAMPVTFSILTNIVTFMPIYFIPGVMGKIFRMIPIVVCIVFMVSLFESLFVLPAHLAHQKDRQRHGFSRWLHARQQAFSHGFTQWVRRRYGPFLEFTLRNRYVTLSIAFAILTIMMSYALSGRMGFGLFPKVESDFSQANIVLPYGAAVEQTQAVVDRVLKGARKVAASTGRSDELVLSMISEIGRSGGHTARVRVTLAEQKIRDKIMTTEEFTRKWRGAVGEMAGVDTLQFASDTGGPGGRGRPVMHGKIHDLADLLGVGFGKRAAKDGKVLREDIDQPPVDLAPAGDDAVAGNDRLVHLELGGPVGDEHIVFFETLGIEQHVDAFARRQLALAVLGIDAALPAAEPRLLPTRFKRRNDFLHAELPLPHCSNETLAAPRTNGETGKGGHAKIVKLQIVNLWIL